MDFNELDLPAECPFRQKFPKNFTPPTSGGMGGQHKNGPTTGVPQNKMPFDGMDGHHKNGTPMEKHPSKMPYEEMGGHHKNGPPFGAPPNNIPYKNYAQFQPYSVSPGAIRPCKYRYIYIWLDNGRSFWAWLVLVDRDSIAGWRWDGRRWYYFGIDIDRVESFECY